MQKRNSAITCQDLQICFGNVTAIDGLTLSIPDHGVTALLGANGAGKSTFINVALGLIKPTSGSLKVLTHAAGSKHTRMRTGVMLQDADLPDLLTPREHLTLVCSYFNRVESVDALIERAALKDFADRRYKKLSGGQKRRVQFAVAIAGNPDLVFLDEPTSGLDPQARKRLWQTVRELSENGTAVLLTTHYLEEADALADHTVVIDRGKIIAQGSSEVIRGLSSGSVIRCQTTVTSAQANAIEGVNEALPSGRWLEIKTENCVATLKQLFEVDPDLSDLTVTKPSLEHAFNQLTRRK